MAGPHNGDIVIAADNVTLDCDGHNVTATGTEAETNPLPAGIRIQFLSLVTVDNCHVTGFFDFPEGRVGGIFVDGSDGVTVVNNSANGNGEGIRIQGSTATVTDNTANANQGFGFVVNGFTSFVPPGSTLTGNIANSNGAVGFLVTGSGGFRTSGNVLDSNRANGNDTNFKIEDTDNNTLSNNVSKGPGAGFALLGLSDNNTFNDNTAIGTGTAATDNTYTNNICIGTSLKSQPSGLC